MGKLKRKLQSPRVRSAALILMAGIMVVFGVTVKLAGRASTALPSDLNNDGVVNVMDLSMLLTNWGKSGAAGDLNGDNTVNVFDLSAMLSDWGKTATPTGSPAVLQLNDGSVGAGMNQFNFSGNWFTDVPAGAYMNDNHYSDIAGNSYQVQFSGTQAKIYTEQSANHGIVGVSIDGGAETMIDTYAATRTEQQLVYTSPVLTQATHTLKVRITGNKNAASAGTYAVADRVDILGASATPTTTPTPSPTATPTSSGTPTVTGVLYYVSNSGNDANTGRSPSSAWKSLGKVNSMLGNGSIKYGDGVVFERGGTFYGSLKGASASQNGSPITFGAYGTGPRPVISGYKILNNQGAWTNVGNNVWKINLVNGTSYSGMMPGDTANNNSNAGFLRVNGTIHGAKKWSQSSLGSQWDFYNDSTYLYVKSSSNPSSMANDLRVSTNGVLVKGFNWQTLIGLEIIGSGGHGYQQTGSRTRISDCYIHEIGGSQLSNTTRYGNGIEMWLGSKDAIIDNNQISDVYDTAVTIQGKEARTTGVHFTNNKIWATTQAFEYWTMGSNSSNGIYDSSFTGNVVVNAGYSWGFPVRPDNTNGQGTALMAYEQQLPIQMDASRNIFFNPRDNMAYSSPKAGIFRSGYVINHNLIALRSGQKIVSQLSYTYEQRSSYISATGQDTQSTWMLVPSSATSPADALNYVNTNLASLKAMIH